MSRLQFEKARKELDNKKREFQQARERFQAAKSRPERRELRKRRDRAQQEFIEQAHEVRAAKNKWAAERLANAPGSDGSDMGALPDFAIIGQRKAGTTFLYHLLTLHPLVRPAASKEPGYFGVFFDQSIEWYRQFFPQPSWEGGRKTITGDATPLMANSVAPKRMAKLVPEAKLIALLRNPVDRTYSDYHWLVRQGREERSFEEAIGLEGNGVDPSVHYVSGSLYVDHLQRWSEYFGRDQMLVLKSEDLYESPAEILKQSQGFLGLPEWEPEPQEIAPTMRNPGSYKEGMAPATRKKLEEFFAPHNERLYEYLGRDFGW